MSRYDDQVLDEFGRPVPGVSIYVYNDAGALDTLTADDTSPLANPLTSDADGLFYFNAANGEKLLDFRFGGRTRYKQEILVGPQPAGSPGPPGPAGANSGTGANVSTRVAMAAIPAPAIDAVAILAEAGREGLFVVKASADFTAEIAADPDQGLYVPSTDDASKVFVRHVSDNVYNPEWWGLTEAFGVGADVPLQSMADAVPPYSIIRLPSYTMLLDTMVIFDKPGMTIEGPKSALVKVNIASAYWSVNDRHLFWCRDSDLTLRGFTMEHFYHSYMAGGNFCVLVSANSVPGGRQIENVTVQDMTFQNCSEGVVIYCTDLGLDDLLPVKNVRISHCLFDQCNYQAMSIFICEDVVVHDNTIRMAPMAVARFTPNIRILGSKRVNFHDNDLHGTGIAPFGGDSRSYGVAVMAAASGATRIANEDVRVADNRIENSRIPFYVEECHGTLTIENNKVLNDPDSTENTFVLDSQYVADNWSARGNQVDHLILRNNSAFGCPNGFRLEGRFGKVEIENNTVETNAKAAIDALRCVELASNAAYFYRSVHIRDNKFLLAEGAGNVCIEANLGAGGYLEATRNRFPAGAHINGEVYATGSAGPLFVTTDGGAGSAVNGGQAIGDNAKFPVGLLATVRAVR